MPYVTRMENELTVKTLKDIDYEPQRIIKGLAISRRAQKTKMFIYSDNIQYRNGEKLTNYIKKHRLGKIKETPALLNPNSGSTIKGWIWTVNWEQMKKWYARPSTNLIIQTGIY